MECSNHASLDLLPFPPTKVNKSHATTISSKIPIHTNCGVLFDDENNVSSPSLPWSTLRQDHPLFRRKSSTENYSPPYNYTCSEIPMQTPDPGGKAGLHPIEINARHGVTLPILIAKQDPHVTHKKPRSIANRESKSVKRSCPHTKAYRIAVVVAVVRLTFCTLGILDE